MKKVNTEKTQRRKLRGVTIYDVAKAAGVSPMTVSRVINADEQVARKTRILVQRTIRDLRYKPNRAARSLAGADDFQIGVLYNNPSTAYFTEFLMGALEGCGRTGTQLVVDKCKISDSNAAIAAVRHLVERGIAGMVLTAPVTESTALITELAARGISTVAVGAADFRGDISRVGIDDFRAAYEMTAHIIGLGHKRLAFVCGHPGHTASHRRRLGFEKAVADAGTMSIRSVNVQGLNTFRSGIEAGEKLLSAKRPPTVVFASNDDMASGLLLVAHRLGIKVPNQLSVVGFDDTIAGSLWPALTTVRQPIQDIAASAIDVVVQNLRSIRKGLTVASKNYLMPHQIVERDTLAPPGRPAKASRNDGWPS